MRSRILISVSLIFLLISGICAQDSSFTPAVQMKDEPSKIYWGGELGLSFGSYFRISLIPLIGYKVTPKFHVGAKLGVAYIIDNTYEKEVTSFNYGGSVLARYLLIKGLYAHTEYAYWSYKYQTENLEGERTWVPFVLVGGGYILPISPAASLFVEVLWDVLKDENSPYDSSQPWVKVGVGVGL
jgi:hypothetical protein